MSGQIHGLTLDEAATLDRAILGSEATPSFLGLSGEPANEVLVQELEPSAEHDAIVRLAAATTELIYLTTVDPDAMQSVISVVASDGDQAMEVIQTESGWEFSTPVPLSTLVWDIADAIGSVEESAKPESIELSSAALAALMAARAGGVDLRASQVRFEPAALNTDHKTAAKAAADLIESGLFTETDEGLAATRKLSSKLIELVCGARISVRRVNLEALVSVQALEEAAHFADCLNFAGPIGQMHHVFSSGGFTSARRLTEEELSDLLSLVLGPRLQPPEFPVVATSESTFDSIAELEAARVLPTRVGLVNSVGIATLEWRLDDEDAAPWSRALLRPEAVIAMEQLLSPGSDGEDETILACDYIAIAGSEAVVWRASPAGVHVSVHRAEDARAEVRAWALQLRDGVPRTGCISLLLRTPENLIVGEELEIKPNAPLDVDELIAALFDPERSRAAE